jgi:membrane protein YdbS with pleckstrin-like domain
VNSAADGGAERFRDTLQANRGAKDASEEDLWQGGYSPKAMIGHWLGAALISVLLLVAIFLIPGMMFNFIAWAVLAGILALLWGGLGVWLLIRRLDVHYQLTSQRFIHKSGVLRRRSDRIEVIDIDDVTFEQGLVERFVGVGTIKITSSDRSHPELKMYGIDGVQKVADIIDNVRREERRRRGVHIESI